MEGVERLTRVDADVALRELEAKVQEAIMYSFENRLVLENKVGDFQSFQDIYEQYFFNILLCSTFLIVASECFFFSNCR